MKRLSSTSVSVILCLCLLAALFGSCGRQKEAAPAVTDLAVMHEPEFGGIYLDMTIDDFNARGFAYGDSVDVRFSNGYALMDLPYYNGYYTQTGSPLLIAYPGYPYIKVCINNGEDLWDVAGIDETATAAVSLHAAGKYGDIQNARDIHYSDERSKFESDAVFANFRAVRVSTMKEHLVYRAASPCDNQHQRAVYVNQLIAQAGVQFIIDLADTEEKINGYLADDAFACDYFLSLYHDGRVLPLAMNMNFDSEEFKQKAALGLLALAEQEGPFLVHCTEGKDRTGFMCMLIEALSGASYQEIVEDYMITYRNYYGIDRQTDPARYDVIVENVLDPMIRSLAGDAGGDLKTADLSAWAAQYLRAGGMTDAQIAAVKTAIEK